MITDSFTFSNRTRSKSLPLSFLHPLLPTQLYKNGYGFTRKRREKKKERVSGEKQDTEKKTLRRSDVETRGKKVRKDQSMTK